MPSSKVSYGTPQRAANSTFLSGVRYPPAMGLTMSVRLGQFCDAALTLATVSRFESLSVQYGAHLSPRGSLPSGRKIWNMFSSQLGVALICAGCWRRNRRLQVCWLVPLWGLLAMSPPLAPRGSLACSCEDSPFRWISPGLDQGAGINAATDFSLYLALAYQTALQEHPRRSTSRGDAARRDDYRCRLSA